MDRLVWMIFLIFCTGIIIGMVFGLLVGNTQWKSVDKNGSIVYTDKVRFK